MLYCRYRARTLSRDGALNFANAHFRSQPQKSPASVTWPAQSLAALCWSEHSRNSVSRAMVVTIRCMPPRLSRSLTTRATKVGRSHPCRHSSRSCLCGKAPDRSRQHRTIRIKSDRSFCGARNRAGVWFNGGWMDSITLSHPLAPTYWTEILSIQHCRFRTPAQAALRTVAPGVDLAPAWEHGFRAFSSSSAATAMRVSPP